MGLSEAMLEIANEIDRVRPSEPEIKMSLVLWSKMIRVAVKASEGNESKQVAIDLAYQHWLAVQKEKEAIRKNKDETDKKFTGMSQCMDGPEEGTMMMVEEVPIGIGARMVVVGSIYELRKDCKLYYDEKQTEALKNKEPGK